VFKRAVQHEKLLVAEATAKEIGKVSLIEALELTLLIAKKEPHRHSRARWLSQVLTGARQLRATTPGRPAKDPDARGVKPGIREMQFQRFRQGSVVVTRSGLPGELFGKISVTVHEVALSAVAMTGTPGVSM